MARKKRHAPSFGAAPSVDLLPKRERAELLHERTMPKLLLAVIGSAVLGGLIWSVGMFPVQWAKQALAESEAESTGLLEELSQYGQVQNLQSFVTTLKQQRQSLTASEVLYIEQFDAVQTLLPAGVAITAFAAQPVGSGESSDTTSATDALGIDGFSRANDTLSSLVCNGGDTRLAFAVSADELISASRLLEDLRALDGFVCGEWHEGAAGAANSTVDFYFALVLDDSVRAHRFDEGAAQ